MTDISHEAVKRCVDRAEADSKMWARKVRPLDVERAEDAEMFIGLRAKVDEVEADNSAQYNALNDRSEMLVAQENEIVALQDKVNELERQRDARRYQGQHD